MPRRRPPRLPRVVLIGLVLIVLVPLSGIAGVLLTLDPDSLKPWITEAVRRATGREMAIDGKLWISRSISPTLIATDVTLANADGGSRPDMLRLERVEARLSLLPLLRRRFEIVSLDLVRPDVLLETDAAGRFNWRLAPIKTAQVTGPAVSGPGQSAPRSAGQVFTIRNVRVEDGRVTWRNARLGRGATVDLATLDLSSASADAPIVIDGRASVADQSLIISGQTGSLARLQDTSGAPAWPLQISVEMPGARLGVSGSVARPLRIEGYSLLLDGAANNLLEVGALAGLHLPPLRNATIAARIADDEGAADKVSSISFHAGPSDLQGTVAGLQIDRVDLTAPRLDQPLHANIDGSFVGAPLRLVAALGPPSAFLPSLVPGPPFPVDLSADVAGAHFLAQGKIASPLTLSGLDLALSARVPDLASLSSLAGRSLPPLKEVAFDGSVADGAGGFGHEVVMRGLVLTLPQGDLAGEVMLGFGARRSIKGTLASKHLDIDALAATLAMSRAPTIPDPATTAQPVAPVAPLPPPPAATPPVERRVISAAPLGLRRLDAADADLQLSAAELHVGGVTYRDVAGHLLLQDGKLVIHPFGGTVPGGALDLNLTIDSRAPEPAVALVLHAPSLSLKSVAEAIGRPDDASGDADVDADVRGSGDSFRSLAASLDGRAGAAVLDGEVDNRVLATLAVEVMRVARFPAELGGAGRTKFRCAAVRIDAAHGVATVGALTFDSGRVLITGAGALNLADETMALRLRPMLRTGPGLVVPVRVTGTLHDPKFAIDSGGALEGLAAKAGIFGALAASRTAERGADACAPAVAAARGGPLPAAASGSAPAKPPKPIDVLRGLLAPNG